jgi:hypothetical protein
MDGVPVAPGEALGIQRRPRSQGSSMGLVDSAGRGAEVEQEPDRAAAETQPGMHSSARLEHLACWA